MRTDSWNAWVASPYTDGYFKSANGTSNSRADFMEFGEDRYGFLMYQPEVPQGATIRSAAVRFRARGAQETNPSVKIYAARAPDALMPSNSREAIAIVDGALTTASVTWSPGATNDGEYHTTPELKSILQELVDQAQWTHDSRIVLVFKDGTNGTIEAESYLDWPTEAPRLTLTYDDGAAH